MLLLLLLQTGDALEAAAVCLLSTCRVSQRGSRASAVSLSVPNMDRTTLFGHFSRYICRSAPSKWPDSS